MGDYDDDPDDSTEQLRALSAPTRRDAGGITSPSGSPLPGAASPLAAGSAVSVKPATTYGDFTRPARPQIPRGLSAEQFLQGASAARQVSDVASQLRQYVNEQVTRGYPLWHTLHWKPDIGPAIQRVMFAHWFSLVQIVFQQLLNVPPPQDGGAGVSMDKRIQTRWRDALGFFGAHVWQNYLSVADASTEWLRKLVANGSVDELRQYFDKNDVLLISTGLRLPTSSESAALAELAQLRFDIGTLSAENNRALTAIRVFVQRVSVALGRGVVGDDKLPSRLSDAVDLLYLYVNELVKRMATIAGTAPSLSSAEPRDTPMVEAVGAPDAGELARLRADNERLQRERDTVQGSLDLVLDRKRQGDELRRKQDEERAAELTQLRQERDQARADRDNERTAVERANATYAAERDRLTSELATVKTERDDLQQRLAQSQAQANVIRDQRDIVHERELAIKDARITELDTQLQEANMQRRETERRATIAQDDLVATQTLLGTRTTELAQSASMAPSLLTAVAALRAKLEQQNNVIKKLQTDLDARQSGISDTVADLRRSLTAAEASAQQLQATLDEVRAQLATTEASARQLRTVLAERDAALGEAHTLLATRTTELAQSASMAPSLLTAVAALRAKIEQQNTRIANLRNELTTCQSDTSSNITTIANLRTELAATSSRLIAMEASTQQLQADVDARGAELGEAHALLATRTTELAQSASMAPSLLTAVAALRTRIENYRVQYLALSTQNAKNYDAAIQWTAEANAANERYNALNTQCTMLQNENVECQSLLALRTTELAQSASMAPSLLTAVAALRAKISVLQQYIQSLSGRGGAMAPY